MSEPLRDISIEVHYNPARAAYELYGHVLDGESASIVVASEKPVGQYEVMEPFAILSRRHKGAQGLIDSLWESGLRPSQSVAGPIKNEMERMDAHLADMRRIAFVSLSIEEPTK